MGVYRRGNGISLVQTFRRVDPITGVETPADPTGVVFTVRAPDDSVVSYTYGVDSEVANPATGVYVCTLVPPLLGGDYFYDVVGTGALVAVGEGVFTILESGVLPPSATPVAEYGPCNGWIDGSYVAHWDPSLGVGSETDVLDDYAAAASQVVFELSGRQFPGVCRQKVRPCRDGCSCFGASGALGFGPWWWGGGGIGLGGAWRNECGDRCGCGTESYVRLAGYPVHEILDVRVDGVSLTPGSDYRLDERRNLIRLADTSATPPTARFWPSCQDLTVADDQPGTFSVLYEWGEPPTELGRLAAAQLAAELWKASPANQGECRLPSRVTRVVRNGVTIDRVTPLAELLRTGATGLQLVDTFIATVNPSGARRRSAVWSPDVRGFGRKVGQ